jgi:hypothetical protein
MKAIEKLIQTAKDEWPEFPLFQVLAAEAEEELQALKSALLASEHIAKTCSELREERDKARRECNAVQKRLDEELEESLRMRRGY